MELCRRNQFTTNLTRRYWYCGELSTGNFHETATGEALVFAGDYTFKPGRSVGWQVWVLYNRSTANVALTVTLTVNVTLTRMVRCLPHLTVAVENAHAVCKLPSTAQFYLLKCIWQARWSHFVVSSDDIHIWILAF